LVGGIAFNQRPEGSCPIIPKPKVYQTTGRYSQLLSLKTASIVIGNKASDPETFAAKRLQLLIKKRFDLNLRILTEEEIKADMQQVILLGQRKNNLF